MLIINHEECTDNVISYLQFQCISALKCSVVVVVVVRYDLRSNVTFCLVWFVTRKRLKASNNETNNATLRVFFLRMVFHLYFSFALKKSRQSDRSR